MINFIKIHPLISEKGRGIPHEVLMLDHCGLAVTLTFGLLDLKIYFCTQLHIVNLVKLSQAVFLLCSHTFIARARTHGRVNTRTAREQNSSGG